MGSHLYVFLSLPHNTTPTKAEKSDEAEAYNTVFSKTLFTPAGIDIYIRSSPSQEGGGTTEQRQELLEKVINAVQASKADGLGELAKKGFQVPGVV
jgi:hypothetical protein